MKNILNLPNVRTSAGSDPEKPAQVGTASAKVPDPPKWLKGQAREEWITLAPELAATWKPRYIHTLAIYCQMIVQYQDDPENFGVARLAQLRGLQCDLGLTPRSQRLVDT